MSDAVNAKIIASELDELVDAAVWCANTASVIKCPARYRAAVRRRIEASGPTSDDLIAVDLWRAQERKQQRVDNARAKTTATVTLAGDFGVTRQRGDDILAAVEARRRAKSAVKAP